jgi:hypothetical protein
MLHRLCCAHPRLHSAQFAENESFLQNKGGCSFKLTQYSETALGPWGEHTDKVGSRQLHCTLPPSQYTIFTLGGGSSILNF